MYQLDFQTCNKVKSLATEKNRIVPK